MVGADIMFLDFLKFVFICLEVVLIFNLLIVVHELGHFLAARWRGLVVEKFAIWFGKPIWSKKIGGVEYRLGSIPAGGFVAIPQLAPMEALEGGAEQSRESLPPVKPLDKIIVAAAGPLFSFGLAFAMACLVWVVGKPQSEFDFPVLGFVKEGGPAYAAGLRPGDKILAVDGKPVKHFLSGTDSVKWRIVRSEGEKIPFTVSREGQEITLESGWTKPTTSNWRRPALREIQVGPRIVPGIGFVVRGSLADKSGLKAGDLITDINGTPIFNLNEIGPVIDSKRGQEITLGVERDGQPITCKMTLPASTSDAAPVNFGIEWGRSGSDVKAAHFSGPVGIMRLYYQIFESENGWRIALAFSVLINVNLALMNLLPFPVLDGGHITLAMVEAIRRKPISVRLLEIVQTACAVLLIGFMLYLTFYDVGDIVASKAPVSQETK
ncbi:MAG: RIP metalloprotease RseP [Verrucomicrobia bacterium]|nr:RIP metalloprotease RseP [Verrucomicrobiota bacterium]